MVEGRQGVLVVDGGEELEREVVVVAGRQVQGDDLLAVELVKEIQRLLLMSHWVMRSARAQNHPCAVSIWAETRIVAFE